MASDFEANMVAVERIEQYSSIPSEAQRFTATDSLVPGGWPDQGAIQFIGAKLRYRPELPLVLRGLDFSIPPGSKVGVVGRTGAGKSTLMVALLRIVELCEGRIMIDGVDHQSLGLSKLRSKIAVIPQDPVLFSGSIRSNLDPFNEYSDETLLDVLARVGLYSSSSSSSGNQSSSTSSLTSLVGQIQDLTDVVQDGGSNYSVGQRQLLVIARALLRGSSIVIMDEATAAVDADTDARIQRVLRNDFVNATCLTVAHRINTIIDSDYILVMCDGRAVEFDTPRALINRGGLFADLVEASGRE
jgi:ABC-type multidrug transport system fused ATPase/permease subunit